MEILTLVVVPIGIALFTLLLEYWVIQPLRQKKARAELVRNIQEVPVHKYLQPNNRDLRLPPNNIVVISAVGIRILDLSIYPHPYKFKLLVYDIADFLGLEKKVNKHRDSSNPKFHFYSDWRRVDPEAFLLPSINENRVYVLSEYPCYELLEAAEMLQGGVISTIRQKPAANGIERLEYEYRMVLDLERLSQKVKLLSVANDKTFYRLQLLCKSVREIKDNGEVIFNDQCDVEIRIPVEYPREHPKIRTTTKIVHPNIHVDGYINFYLWWIDLDDQELSIASMCLVIIEMIEGQQFSLSSPFSTAAADQYRYIKSIVPLDSRNLKGF